MKVEAFQIRNTGPLSVNWQEWAAVVNLDCRVDAPHTASETIVSPGSRELHGNAFFSTVLLANGYADIFAFDLHWDEQQVHVVHIEANELRDFGPRVDQHSALCPAWFAKRFPGGRENIAQFGLHVVAIDVDSG